MNIEFAINIGLNALLGLAIWSLKAQIREIANTLIETKISEAKKDMTEAAQLRWQEHEKWGDTALKGIYQNHEASLRRIELLERTLAENHLLASRMARIEAIVERIEKKLDSK